MFLWVKMKKDGIINKKKTYSDFFSSVKSIKKRCVK